MRMLQPCTRECSDLRRFARGGAGCLVRDGDDEAYYCNV